MRTNSKNTFCVFKNPIDDIEDIVHSYELEFLRNTFNEIIIYCQGNWTSHNVIFNWNPSNNIIRIQNNLDILIPKKLSDKIRIMISLINEDLKLGYFGFFSDKKSIYFQHNILLKGQNYFSTEQIEECIDSIVTDCDKYFPAFQIFLHKINNPRIAIKSALVETLGEA